jgi:hypothetical protein
LLQVEATSSLNFNAPFLVKYNSRDVTQFQSSGPPSAAGLTVTPEQVAFAVIPTGSSQDKTFTISNPGSAVLTGSMTLIASGSGAGVFTLVSEDTINVAPGQSQVVTVRYNAGSSDLLTGSLRISTNAGVKTVILSGQGQRPPQLGVDPVSANFGTVPVQQSSEASFTVTNIGGGTLTGNVSTAAPFSVVSGGNFSLNLGQSQTVTVRFVPTVTGEVSNGQASITSNGGSAVVTLNGIGGSPSSEPNLPELGVTRGPNNEWDVGSAGVGSTTGGTFFINNSGGGTLTGTISVAAPFSVSPTSFSLSPAQQLDVALSFTPTTVGPATATITFTSNGGNATVTAKGTGTP